MRSTLLLSAGLFSALGQLSSAINVYLSPEPASFPSSLSSHIASNALSRHLGLDHLEPLSDSFRQQYNGQNFVGTGSSNAILLAVDEADVAAILPFSLQPAFIFHETSSTPIDTLSSVISTFRHRAAHTFASIYDGTAHALELAHFFESAETPSFAALELTRLSEIRNEYGPSSNEYALAAEGIRETIQQAYNHPDMFNLAILTFSSTASSSLFKREPQSQATQSPLPPTHPSPQEPIGAISTCFTSAEVCNNSTNSCSGRGKCLAATKSGRTCFVCTCGVTKSGEGSKVKTDVWVGQSCERKDISGPFVLLTGTVVVLLVLIFGSVSLLSSVGSLELPSVLLATAVGAKKD
ncbi:hypothetical protein H0H93_016209 [Arthromyces matolae]|nr:hypothetical protein H0H93_016209 [Arthromyces matolae]